MKPTLIHLPSGRYLIEYGGLKSYPVYYHERLIATLGRRTFVAQTEYWGEETIWEIAAIIPHNSKDESV